jgi:hypothetical protein
MHTYIHTCIHTYTTTSFLDLVDYLNILRDDSLDVDEESVLNTKGKSALADVCMYMYVCVYV